MTGSRQLVLVTGPPRSGVTSLVATLRERMPELAPVEATELGQGDVPTAVVVVVSGVAPMTESDCRQVDVATGRSDVVIGVVSKVDAHRGWREVLAACALSYRAMRWVAVAAAPDIGASNIDGLVESLRDTSRKPLLANDIRVGRLRAGRTAMLRDRRQARSARALILRGGLHETRAALGRFVRQRCVAMRTDFRARTAELSRGDFARFEADLLDEAETMLDELEQQLLARSDELAGTLDVAAPAYPRPGAGPQLPASPTAPRQERRLTMVLGAGFGLGVAMAVSRLLGGLDQGLAVAALVGGAASGVGLTVWLVITRALLQERALYDRWVGEVVTTLRWHGEELVAGRLLAVELGFAAELAARDEAESADLSERVGAIDAELRMLSRLTAVVQED
ncbi:MULTISPECIES: hypothetical protein [unclassified Mycobacterium]|uniref:hypothetical protein n=1 Tax=unclassified Mycobacterium TaxID=2642494 RepID=UPI0029C6833D|nr:MULTISPECIES: hypothetical protein [unclassified Mycobacterium]